MTMGRNVHIKKHMKAVHVAFIPELQKFLGVKACTCDFVDSYELEWIELSPETRISCPVANVLRVYGGESVGRNIKL